MTGVVLVVEEHAETRKRYVDVLSAAGLHVLTPQDPDRVVYLAQTIKGGLARTAPV